MTTKNATHARWWWRFKWHNLRDSLYFRISFWLPRRLMYFAINRAILDGRKVYGDKWLFTLHKLGNVRSEYGGMGMFGRGKK